MVVSIKHIFLSTWWVWRRDDGAPSFVFSLSCLLLLLFCTACHRSNIPGTDEEHAYDHLQLKGKWKEIVQKDERTPTQSLACRKVVEYAQCQLGVGSRATLHRCLEDSHDVLTSPTSALMMSDIYMRLGMVAMAQRAAFEAMVKMGDVKHCERPLRRLAEVALITGETDLVLKYASLLEDFSASRKWAQQMKQLALHPEFIGEESAYGKLKKQYEHTEDEFFL